MFPASDPVPALPAASRSERLCRGAWMAGLAIFLAHLVTTTTDGADALLGWSTTPWGVFAAFELFAMACAARAVAHPAERLAWGVMSVGIASYGGAQAIFTLFVGDYTAPFPTVADVMWMSLYPLAAGAVALLVRARLRLDGARVHPHQWLDGVIAALAITSFGAWITFELIINPVATPAAAPANVAYALGDLVLIGFALGGCAMFRWRPPASLLVLLAGFLVMSVEDSLYLSAVLRGELVPGTLLDSFWLLGLLIVGGAAAWTPLHRRAGVAAQSGHRRELVLPLVLAFVTIALSAGLAFDSTSPPLAVVLVALTLVALAARFALTSGQHLRMIDRIERVAETDALTGLPNRRKLMGDIEAAFASATAAEPVTLAVFDLDGFKAYNDSYGHPAGDALLVRLATKLASAVAPNGRAYRLGGDEFCALIEGNEMRRLETLMAATEALSEAGEAFSIGCSHGSVDAPTETADAERAFGLADARLYTVKDSRPAGTAQQIQGVLRQILAESEPELDDHVEIVADLVQRVSTVLGITGVELRDIARAAELHDIGKLAIPDAILHKPGRLDAEEWAFMQRHTIIGEAMLAPIPSLRSVAELVRSSHERFDGTGYPDRLAGDAIPLGARIIFVCDAYEAMVATRPYSNAMTHEEAIAELRRHAGTQFDPDVVAAFVGSVSSAQAPLAVAA